MENMIYKGVELIARPRSMSGKFVVDLDLRDMGTGLVFQRWWPVPTPEQPGGHDELAQARTHAFGFGRAFLDQT